MPYRCCATVQCSSLPSPDGAKWCGPATNTAASAPAATHQRGAPARLACPQRTTSAGTSQTQWCDHEIGDTTNAATAFTRTATGGSTRRMTNTAAASTAATSTAAATACHTGGRPSRVSSATMVWFVANGEPLNPDAPVSSTSQ